MISPLLKIFIEAVYCWSSKTFARRSTSAKILFASTGATIDAGPTGAAVAGAAARQERQSATANRVFFIDEFSTVYRGGRPA